MRAGLVLFAALALAACRKSTSVDVQPGAGGQGGNDNASLPVCPGGVRPATRGPPLVHVGRLGGGCGWMDQTEVTRAQYLEFVASAGSDAGAGVVADVCKGKNTDLGPSKDVDLAKSDHPVAGVDWCDAASYCLWAGKKLCDTYAGAGAARSFFETTCTDGDGAGFDYGALVRDAGKCNGSAAPATAPVKSFGACVTPTLVFDLVGNVAEWTAECDGADFAKPCLARGGSYESTGEQWGCKAKQSFPRDFARRDLGFRCCADDGGADAGGD